MLETDREKRVVLGYDCEFIFYGTFGVDVAAKFPNTMPHVERAPIYTGMRELATIELRQRQWQLANAPAPPSDSTISDQKPQS